MNTEASLCKQHLMVIVAGSGASLNILYLACLVHWFLGKGSRSSKRSADKTEGS